jgi:hypothetical protein
MPNIKISQLTTATAVSATNQFEINQNAASRSLEVSVLSTYIRSGDSAKAIVVSVSTASDALRITQTGAGNALVVEDSANPDSSPFVIDAAGNVGIGTSSPNSLLELNKASGAADLRFSVAGTLYGTAYASSSDMTINSVTAIPLKLGTNNTERMQIDASGNVGIGTASPVTTQGLSLHLYNSANTGTVASNACLAIDSPNRNAVLILNGVAGATNSIQFSTTLGTSVAGFASEIANQNLIFRTGGTTEQARIDSSGNFQFNSGYGSVATAYGCRAWVNFNGTGTVAIRASGNVTSITDNNVGDYTVNFANAMPDANYAMIGQGGTGNGRVVYEYNGTYNTANSTTVRTSSSCRILYADTTTGAASDNAGIYVSFFR